MEPIWKGSLDWGKGNDSAVFSYKTASNHLERKKIHLTSLEESFESLLKTAWEGPDKVIPGPEAVGIVGHRVVHGGNFFLQPTRITEKVKTTIHELERLAPLHNPSNLKGIEIVEQLLPEIPQYAVFDTAFHATMQKEASIYPIPEDWRKLGIKKYGFHGISHQYCSQRVREIKGVGEEKKIITCHLGNGSSLAAINQGRCVDTTMGFTPLDGLMMGTRSGSIDPGIIAHLLREKKNTIQDIEKALYNHSGMMGICGFSDMRYIQDEMHHGNESAKLAFDMYVYRLKCFIGYMASAINGIDLLVFTGGIGEHAHEVRKAACAGLSHLGVFIEESLNENENGTPDLDISAEGSKVCTLIIHTREEYAIARSAHAI
jgi:acetate kinase